ncbi:hypothetical protein KFZ58_17610 [Virgibacillus sp. NKC19-16]|uniref:hypothetical protein n=1 Tax=Virgibacillus salidurans TaxID=2831673 RepID=UPI001F3B1CBD|nr:hypothetical protein [Virgibacillus sp. NKC19-16]UJL46151.1 hypothetical protein KFZ58_17610 [Virgibacillus sp. NKC19-16]
MNQKKNYQARYNALSKEFEEGLRRPLTAKEKNFLKWLVTKERAEHESYYK